MEIPIIYDSRIRCLATVVGDESGYKIVVNPRFIEGLDLNSIILHEMAHIERKIDFERLKNILRKVEFEVFSTYSRFEVKHEGTTIFLLEREGWELYLKIPKKEPRIKKPNQLTEKLIYYWISTDLAHIYYTGGSGEILAEYYAASQKFNETLENRIKIMVSDNFFKLDGEGQRYHMRYLMGIYLALNYGSFFFENPEMAFEYLIKDIDNLYIFLRGVLGYVYHTIKLSKKDKGILGRIWNRIKSI